MAFALTGERIDVAPGAGLADALAAAHLNPARLAAIRHAAQLEQRPWPFPVPLEERRALGFARFDAALAEARQLLGLDGLDPHLQARRPLDRDEQRLQADRPPHWG